MKYLLSFLVSVLVFPAWVGAATSTEFTFRAIVGDDILPPTTPVLESVTPVTATQIDVSWSATTDNWIFGGYVLWRDGVPIATTTQTSFNDTGLTETTLYTYEVQAFDAAGNYSTTSNSISTTTLSIVVPPPPATTTPGTTSGTRVTRLVSFLLTPSEQGAVFDWETSVPARFVLRWGQTDDFNGGYIESSEFSRSRITKLTGLEPGTRYLYELIGLSPGGVWLGLKSGEFTTLAPARERVMPNVERLSVVVEGNDVTLRYALPRAEPSARVRIVRSHLGWPEDGLAGAVVYEGTAEIFVDRGALFDHDPQYYTIFAIGSDGTIASGALGLARRPVTAPDPSQEPSREPDQEIVPDEVGLKDPASSIIALASLSPESILVIQGDRSATFAEVLLVLDQRESFTVRIPRMVLPPHLKSILVSLLDPTDQRRQYAFLLRLNKAGDAYEATIAPVGVAGASRLQVEIFDLTQLMVGRYRVPVNFSTLSATSGPVIFPDALWPIWRYGWPLLGFPIVVLLTRWWLLWWHRRKETEDKK